MSAEDSVKYSMTRPRDASRAPRQDADRTGRLARKDEAEPGTLNVRTPSTLPASPRVRFAAAEALRTPARAPVCVKLGQNDVAIEWVGDAIAIILPGAVRLVATRDQIDKLVGVLTAMPASR